MLWSAVRITSAVKADEMDAVMYWNINNNSKRVALYTIGFEMVLTKAVWRWWCGLLDQAWGVTESGGKEVRAGDMCRGVLR
jgi:hypothetical protein